VAASLPGTGNVRLAGRPFRPAYLAYLILSIDSNQQTALGGYPGRGYG
jgi:hypothetical protein